MGRISDTVKHLIIINVIFFIATQLYGDVLYQWFSLWFFGNDNFSFWQVLTHMFMHGGFMHLFFNMLWLLFMGPNIERLLGDKHFLILYMVSGIGATILYMGTQHFLFGSPPYMLIGASGAVAGVMLTTALFFPNAEIILFPIPIPIKMKYFVIGYAAYELFQGLTPRQGDNVAHFAHLGGMVFAFILLKIWNVKTSRW